MHYGSASKKLKGAVGYLLGGSKSQSDPDLIADLEKSGAPPEIIESYKARAKKDHDFIVHYDNWAAVRLYLACLTQWRRGGMNGQKIGLDYVAVEITARAKGIELNKENFEGLQVMEAESLRIYNERN